MKLICTMLLLALTVCAGAQDVLIKNDRSELRVKVSEITETSIKYRLWDNQDGPLYNIAKHQVFMVIYANGQRETFAADTHAQPDAPAETTGLSQLVQQPAAALDTSVNYKNLKIKYSPSRLLYWFDSPPTTLSVQQESRIVKNVLNLGFATDYFFVTDYSQTLYSFYLAPYLPLNRVLKNYEKQDKGLFIHGKVGYSVMSVTIDGKGSSTGGLMVGAGADYFITKKFGLTLSGFKFKDSKFFFQGGFCVNIL